MSKHNGTLIVAGDLNLAIHPKVDQVNRSQSYAETNAIYKLSEFCNKNFLIDAYRVKNATGGFTWQRGATASRLDHIFVASTFKKKILSAVVHWDVDKSDHGAVFINLNIQTVEKGPGIHRVNIAALSDKRLLDTCKIRLLEYINLIDSAWDPNKKLQFIKMSIRSVIEEKSTNYTRANRLHKNGLEEELQTLRLHLDSLLIENNKEKIIRLSKSIAALDVELDTLRSAESKHLAMRAKTKWYNEGERSNKYFLNIIKKRQAKQQRCCLLDSDGNEKENIKDKLDIAYNFYKNLYRKDSTTSKGCYDFLRSCQNPVVNETQNKLLDNPITLGELYETLKTCGESAPGQDGITYKTYLLFWDLVGSFLLEAWNYCLLNGYFPSEQVNSVIILLDKKGKDVRDLANLRPISLSNCDIKLFTKVISNRLQNILPHIVHTTQTAYIRGRQVHDNLNFIRYCKDKAVKDNSNLTITSLDAKKAFDSVDHEYLYETLKTYGFSSKFIGLIKSLYSGLTACVMVNGFKTNSFKVERSVKQGDALSCALFILAIDPVIRHLNLAIKNPIVGLSNQSLPSTACYADDIAVISNTNSTTISKVFSIYEKFSYESGLFLNANKTEMISNHANTFPIKIYKENINISTITETKICGRTFSFDPDIETTHNVDEKIGKLEKMLQIWQSRSLTVMGKILIVKTFGLSQLIFLCNVLIFLMIDLLKLRKL